MPFRVEVLAEFPGVGHLEHAVHNLLAACRNPDGRGREWFKVPLAEALHAVACVMARSTNSADAAEACAATPAASGGTFASSTSGGSGSAAALAGRSAALDSDSA